MAISITESNEEVVVKVEADLDLSTVPAFQDCIASATQRRGSRKLVIDLTSTDYVDSAGLEQLLMVARQLSSNGGSITLLVAPGKQPETVLGLTGFSAVIDVQAV